MDSMAQRLCREGKLKKALNILHLMDSPAQASTYILLLRTVVNMKILSPYSSSSSIIAYGKLIHAHMAQTGGLQRSQKVLHNTLLNMYAKLGSLTEALKIFQTVPVRDDFSWTVLISAFSKKGPAEKTKALQLFSAMRADSFVKPSKFTFVAAISACLDVGSLRNLHSEVRNLGFSSDFHVGSALVDKYAEFDCLQDAVQAFDEVPTKDLVLWNTMLSAHVKNGGFEAGIRVFQDMQVLGIRADHYTFTGVMQACGHKGDLGLAKEVHEELRRNSGVLIDSYVGSMLIDMYIKCGSLQDARHVFDDLAPRDTVPWNCMIAGYASRGCPQQALDLFRRMQQLGIKLNSHTFTSVIPACSHLAALEQASEIHEQILRHCFQDDVVVGSALVDMYGKCGCVEKAREVFDRMPERNEFSWTAMICGYAMNGCVKEALQLFDLMSMRASSSLSSSSIIRPTDVTLLCVLTACCHAGMVEQGKTYFGMMFTDFGIVPSMEHYGCMVDLLARSGLLDEARDFINGMPIKPDWSVWCCFVAACKKHGHVELAEWATQQTLDIEPPDTTAAAPYVLLSNAYSETCNWDATEKVRRMLKERGVKKTPGSSWIEINKKVHFFLAGDDSQPLLL